MDTFTGTIEVITYYNPENGYTVLKVTPDKRMPSRYTGRDGRVAVVGVMLVATYVHVVVDDPALFPLQPTEPIVPLIVIAMCAYILWKGAGAWSSDLRATRA